MTSEKIEEMRELQRIAERVLPVLIEIRWREFWQWYSNEYAENLDRADVWHQFEDQIATCEGGYGESCQPMDAPGPPVEVAWKIAEQMMAEHHRRLDALSASPEKPEAG